MNFLAALVAQDAQEGRARWAQLCDSRGGPVAQTFSNDGKVTFEVSPSPTGHGSVPQIELVRGCSLLCGRYYSASYEEHSAATLLSYSTVDEIHRSSGACLSRLFWGDYVGLFFDPADGTLLAVRCPGGGRLLYIAANPDIGLTLFSDCLETLCSALEGSLALDRKTMAMSLAYSNGLPSRRTAFKEIANLLPGECRRLDRNGRELTTALPWWEMIARGSDRGPNLSDAFRGVVSALARSSGKIALQLSGGLDSSGLLGELAQQGLVSQVHCLSVFRSEGVTDERHFAELAARYVNASLTHVDIADVSYSLKMADRFRFSPRPHSRIVFSQMGDLLDQEAKKYGCDSYWLGYGGDSLFMNYIGAPVLIDALFQEGISVAWQTAIEVALQAEDSLWHVGRQALTGLRSSKSVASWSQSQGVRWEGADEELLDADGGAFALIDHALSACPYPGQRRRLYDVYYDMWVTAEQRHLYTAGGLDYFRPFYTEPMMAASLAIPAHQTIKYGLNRYPQRELLSKTMPRDITMRVGKGGADDHVVRSLLDEADQVEAALIDGHLAKAGLIDPKNAKVDRSKIMLGEAHKNFHVIHMLACELWIAGHADVLRK